jgi:hypothetical protein
MADVLRGKRVAALVDAGFEQVELIAPTGTRAKPQGRFRGLSEFISNSGVFIARDRMNPFFSKEVA